MKSYFYNQLTGLINNVLEFIGTVILHLYSRDIFHNKKESKLLNISDYCIVYAGFVSQMGAKSLRFIRQWR